MMSLSICFQDIVHHGFRRASSQFFVRQTFVKARHVRLKSSKGRDMSPATWLLDDADLSSGCKRLCRGTKKPI